MGVCFISNLKMLRKSRDIRHELKHHITLLKDFICELKRENGLNENFPSIRIIF